jgi:hypothetical protein
MNKSMFFRIMIVVIIVVLLPFSCTKKNARNNTPENGEISLSDINIEKKYLTEGFISGDLYRVVIVTPKDSGAAELEAVRIRAKKRARVSLERSLAEENIPGNQNMKAEILNLIEQNGQLARKDIGHSRYHVYYFNIIKKNIKNYLKNASSRE